MKNKKKKTKNITKNFLSPFILLLIACNIYIAYTLYSLTYKYIPSSIQTIENLAPINLENLNPSLSPSEKLHDEYISLANKYDLDITKNDRISFLNNGYSFFAINDNSNQIANFLSAYSNLLEKDKTIYISANVLNHYFESKYFEIRESISNKNTKSNLKHIYTKSETSLEIDDGIVIKLENNIEDYVYIKNHLQYLSEYFPEFNNLKEDILSVIDYTTKQDTNREIDSIKNNIIKILKNLPDVTIGENESFGYLISTEESSLIIYPQIIPSDSIFKSNNNNFNEDYDVMPIPQQYNSVRIPILMFHQIGYAPVGSSSFKQGLYTSPELFEQQIAYLTRKNYKSVSSEEFLEILKSGKNPTQKTVILTFDDSVANHYSTAYQILKKYRQTGVFFVVSNRSSITAEQLKQMSDNGMDIQSHTCTHPDLTKVQDTHILISEIGGSKEAIQYMTGKPVIAIAYPGCVANSQVYNIVTSSGYSLGFSCGKNIDHYFNNRLSLARVHIPTDLNGLINVLSGVY